MRFSEISKKLLENGYIKIIDELIKFRKNTFNKKIKDIKIHFLIGHKAKDFEKLKKYFEENLKVILTYKTLVRRELIKNEITSKIFKEAKDVLLAHKQLKFSKKQDKLSDISKNCRNELSLKFNALKSGEIPEVIKFNY